MKKVRFIGAFLVLMMVINVNGGFTANAGSLDFEPGEVIFGMKEPYTGSIDELFPELDFVEVDDLYKNSYEGSKDLPFVDQKGLDNLISKIGTVFYAKLANKSTEATLGAIQYIAKNPIVKYAQPNYIYYQAGRLRVAPLTVSPNEGSYLSSVTVTLTSGTEGAIIYYTTDGTLPNLSNNSSTKYTGPIELTSTTTINAVAYKEAMSDSEVLEVTFTVEPPDEETYIPGDVSGNGFLDFGDVGLLLNHLMGIYELTNPIMLRNADINKDGILRFDDIGIMLLRLGLVS